MDRKYVNIVLILLFAGALSVFYFFDPTEFTFFPGCYFRKFTGFDCPGCGGQRALHDLLHLRFTEAIDHNLLMVAGSPVLAFVAVNALFVEKKRYFKSTFLWGIIAVVLLFWVIRNLPFESFRWLQAG